MPSIDFEVWCGTCGAGICGNTRVDGQSVSVKVCADCLEKERDEAYSAGFDDGYQKAVEDMEER